MAKDDDDGNRRIVVARQSAKVGTKEGSGGKAHSPEQGVRYSSTSKGTKITMENHPETGVRTGKMTSNRMMDDGQWKDGTR